MNDVFVLFMFLTGAIAATLFFLQGAFYVITSASSRHGRTLRDFVLGKKPLALSRAADNPVLRPSNNAWEAAAVMNPAAFAARGLVHLFYRAIGTDGVSRIGYASSEDGLHFNERLPYPAYALTGGDEKRDAAMRRHYHPDLYKRLLASGGSWSGTEDPRAVVIDDRLFLTFSVFNDWSSLRIGVTSLSLSTIWK